MIPEEDIVRRIRGPIHDRLHELSDGPGELCQACWDAMEQLDEAADEIERLRECLKETRAAAKAFLRELGKDAQAW